MSSLLKKSQNFTDILPYWATLLFPLLVIIPVVIIQQHFTLSTDWRNFYAAGLLLSQNHNPYSISLLLSLERSVFNYYPASNLLGQFANTPLTCISLPLITLVPFWYSFVIFEIVSFSLAFLAIYKFAKRLSLPVPLAFAIAPLFCLLAIMQLYFNPPILLLLAGTLVCLMEVQKHPRLVGLLSVIIAAVRPNTLFILPLLLFFVLFRDKNLRKNYFLSSIISLLFVVGLPELLHPGITLEFIKASLSVAGTIHSAQPSLGGLVGLSQKLPFLPILGLKAGLLAELFLILFFIKSKNKFWNDTANRLYFLLPLGLVVWLLFTPYSHFNDEL